MLIKPQQLDAERAVICCIIDKPGLFYDSNLKPDMFFGIDNVVVYKAITDLFLRGKTLDIVLLSNELVKNGEYELIGGDTYFEAIASTEHLESNFREYIKLVSDAYLSRQVIDAGKRIADAGYSGSAEHALDLAFEETSKLLNAVNFGSDVSSVHELMSNELVALLERMQNPGCSGIPTGFTEYDLITGGLAETDEVIIAARPSVGKTALGLRIMLNVAKQDIPILYFSYEMSHRQLMQRLLSMESGVSLSKIRNGMLNEKEATRLLESANAVGDLPITINNNFSASATEIVTKTKKLVRDYGIKLVVVDYIQLMPFRTEFATLDLGGIARRLKSLAMSTDITLILISQLNRLVEMRQDKIPILSDLRQSGNLEEHADVVLMLHREDTYNATEENKGKTDLFIRKNRNGPLGVIPLMFNDSSVNFRSGIL